MVKKFFSTVLVSIMILSVVPAWAGMLAVNAEAIILSDDFTQATTGPVATYSSDVWKQGNNATMEIVEENGNKAMKLTQVVGQNSSIQTIGINHAEAGVPDVAYYDFRFKLPEESINGRWFMGWYDYNQSAHSWKASNVQIKNGSIGLNSEYGNLENVVSLTADTWYRVVAQSRKVGDNTITNVGIYDETQGLIVTGREISTADAGPLPKSGFYIGSSNVKSVAASSIIIDDCKIIKTISASKPAFVSSSVSNGAEDVSATTVVDFVYNQPVAVPSGITCTYSGGTAECTATAFAPDTIRISFTQPLNLETAYTLTVPAVTSQAGAVAKAGTTISFTTTSYNPVDVKKDNFENAALQEIKTATPYQSDVWDITGTTSSNMSNGGNQLDAQDIQIIRDGDNKVLSATQVTGNFGLGTSSVTLASGEALYTAFKFKTLTSSTTHNNAAWMFGIDNGAEGGYYGYQARGVVTAHSNGQFMNHVNAAAPRAAYEHDTWYTALIERGTTAATAYIYGEDGLVFSLTRDIQESFKARAGLSVGNIGSSLNYTILVDDSEKMVMSGANTISFTGSNITEGATDVALWPTVDLTFDIPVAEPASNAVTLQKNSEAPVVVPAIRVGYNTIRVVTGVLDPSANYTIDFSGVKGLANNNLYGTSTLSFTTTATAKTGVEVRYPQSMLVMDSQGSGSATIQVANYDEAKTGNVSYLMVFYGQNDALLGVNKVEQPMNHGLNDVTFTWNAFRYLNTTKAKLWIWNNMTDLQPLAGNTIVTK